MGILIEVGSARIITRAAVHVMLLWLSVESPHEYRRNLVSVITRKMMATPIRSMGTHVLALTHASETSEALAPAVEGPSKFPQLVELNNNEIQNVSVFDKIKHRRKRGSRSALAIYTPPSQLNGVSEFAESRDISMQFTYIARAQIRDVSVWQSIGFQTMRQLKQLNTTDIAAVARAMASMGYRDTFVLNGLADAMWCLAKVRRGRLFDSSEILYSFRKLNFIPRMIALDAITADLRRQGWDKYKWRSADISRVFLYYSSLPPRIADKLRDQDFLPDLEVHIEARLGRMSARDLSLISRATSIDLDRITEALLRSKDISTGNLLYYCVTLLKAGVTRPPANFMNRVRREIDSTFTQLKPSQVERFLHIFMNFDNFSDERILTCLARATESNLERMSQRRLRSILLAFHRLCKPNNSLLPQLAARVRATVPREDIHAETIVMLMRAFAAETPLKQQQNIRLIMSDLGRQLVERLRSKGEQPAQRERNGGASIPSIGPDLESRPIETAAAPAQRIEASVPEVETGSFEKKLPTTTMPAAPRPADEERPARDEDRIPSIKYASASSTLDDDPAMGLDEEQLAILKQMEDEVEVMQSVKANEIIGNKETPINTAMPDLGPRGEYDDYMNSDRVSRLMHVVVGKHPAHHRLVRKLKRMENKLADVYPENDDDEPVIRSREYREVVRRWKARKSRELTGVEKHHLAAGFETFTIRWRKWRRRILARYTSVDFDSLKKTGPTKIARGVPGPKKLAFPQKKFLALRKSVALAEALKDSEGLVCRSEIFECLVRNARKHIRVITDAKTAVEEFAELLMAISASGEHLDASNGPLVAGVKEALGRDGANGAYLSLATAYTEISNYTGVIDKNVSRLLLDRCLDDPTVRPDDLLIHVRAVTVLVNAVEGRRDEVKHRVASALATPSTEALSSASVLQNSLACLHILGEDVEPVCRRLLLSEETVERAAAAIRARFPYVSA